MTNAVVGHIGTYVGLISAVVVLSVLLVGSFTGRTALVHRAVRCVIIPFLGAVLATIAMEHALITHDFSLSYVAENNSRQTPFLYCISGLWSALQGSILLWVLILTGYVAYMAHRFRRHDDDRLFVTSLAVALVVVIYFFGLVIGPADPFVLAHTIVANGTGPNPLLQDNLLVAFHPVLLYLGYVGFTVPFAFAIGSLITGRVGEGWLVATRRSAVFAWACLTLGIVLGAWWSYQTLGWGGAWGWDPVENVAILPWLTATAYLHSVMVQERRGLLRIWNLSLLIATFSLTILGTFLDRSGVVVSVHAFSGSGLGPTLLIFFAVIVLGGIGLIGWRGDRLASVGTIDAPVSREGAFLMNNLLFASFAFIVLLGTVVPIFVQALNGNSISIGRPYFDTFAVPIGLALLFFMAVAPALPWRKASDGVLRERLIVPAWVATAVLVGCVIAGLRGFVPLLTFTLGAFAAAGAVRQLVLATIAAHRHGLHWWRGIVGRANGGMIAHIGVILIAIGLCASTSYVSRALITLKPGATAIVEGHRLTFIGWERVNANAEVGYLAKIEIGDNGIFRPGIVNFDGSPTSTAMPSIDSTPVEDVYLELAGGAGIGLPVSLEVIIEPIAMWLWIGGGLTAAGAFLAMVPTGRRRPTDPVSVLLPELIEEPLVVGR